MTAATVAATMTSCFYRANVRRQVRKFTSSA